MAQRRKEEASMQKRRERGTIARERRKMERDKGLTLNLGCLSLRNSPHIYRGFTQMLMGL